MSDSEQTAASGFGLIELVITMFLLILIALAALPALYNGLAYSSTQSQAATATRYLYSVIEQGREDALTAGSTSSWCAHRTAAVASTPGAFTAAVTTCTVGAASLVTLELTATSTGPHPRVLSSVTAKVYVP